MSFLKDEVCLITGGSGGIGSAITTKFAEAGAKVMICDKVLPGDKHGSNPNIDFVECDVTSKASFSNAFKVTKERFGKVDVVINNAGVLKEAKYEDLVNINLIGVMHGCQLALEHMERGGLVINIGSVVGIIPMPIIPAYCASKAAVISYTRNLGSEHHFQKHGIRFMCVCPSYVLTRIIEAPYLDPEDGDIAPLIQQVVQEAKDKNLCLKPETLAADLVELIPVANNGSAWLFKQGHKPELVPSQQYEM